MTTPTKTSDRGAVGTAIRSPFFLAASGSVIALAVLGIVIAHS